MRHPLFPMFPNPSSRSPLDAPHAGIIVFSGLRKRPRNLGTHFAPASAEKGYLSAARFTSPELPSRFEPVAREQFKQVVTNRMSQFFIVDSFKSRDDDVVVLEPSNRRAGQLPSEKRGADYAESRPRLAEGRLEKHGTRHSRDHFQQLSSRHQIREKGLFPNGKHH